ncbi:response regulator [Kineosporia babensis]|uniref:Response regulator n=1 Tax=Kineosporia babensis TaxID=499548 RepID=A0A9X1NAG1_9ACTN|nr:response regulator [Kineosporia babensis]
MSKVLVVEDDSDIRRLLEIRLARMGHTVISVPSADDAQEAIRRYGVPDLVVLDIVMHGTSGLELLRELRSSPEAQDLPVILLTARDLQEDQRVARELHAHLMQKPIEAASLNRVLDQVLSAS